jgi:hypothetical protein
MNALNRASVLLIGLLLFLSADPTAAQTRGPKKTPEGAPIVLQGTIIAPGGVIRHGYVAIMNGRIENYGVRS